MASIVQRNKSFSVVYTTYTEGRKKQKWETYHSYEAALQRKEQIELIQAKQKENLQSHAETLADLLWEYVALYGQSHWSYCGGDAADRIQSENHCNAVQQDTLSAELDTANANLYP